MDEKNNSARSTARINCQIKGNAAETLIELKKRGIIQNNREAVVQGLFALEQKVMKSDLEKSKLKTLAQQNVYLRPWDEIVGTLSGTEITHTEITALLTCTYEKHIAITIPKDKPEIQQLQEQLQTLQGQKIAIFKTDNPQKPFIVRTLNEAKPNNSAPAPREVTSNQLGGLPRPKIAKQKPQLRHIVLSRTCGVVIGSTGLDSVRVA
jgi:hypothetical protein